MLFALSHVRDTIYPDWEAYPCLDDVITTADVEEKGKGKFAANYVNWMRTHLLRKHAAGWQFELRTYVDKDGIETDVWRAPITPATSKASSVHLKALALKTHLTSLRPSWNPGLS